MKKLIYIVLIIGLFSCEEALLEEPKSIGVEVFYNTKSEIESALAASYDAIRKNSMNAIALHESFADYQYGRGSWGPNSNYEGLNATNITRSESVWVDSYLAIRNANIVIINAPEGTELSDDEKSKAIAEAKFVRAFCYFDLVRNYKGVPIRTEDNFTEYEVGRDTEEAVWELIVNDLKEAENILPDDAPLPGRASRWSAKTVLADVYFYRGMNSEAAAKSNEVIESNKYTLVPVNVVEDYANLFGPDVVTTSEEIFYKKFSHEQGDDYTMMLHHPGSGLCGAGGWYGLYTDIEQNNFMKNWTDMDDLRRQLWYNWDIGLGENTYLSLKFVDPEAPSYNNCANDYPIYRYADVLLMNAEAECLASGNISNTTMERLNMVHRRAYGYDPTSASPVDFNIADYNVDSFAELVVLERAKETQCEAKRWFDLKRLGVDKLKAIVKESTGRDVLDKHLLYPIPVAEMEYNKAIDPIADQNPGY
ncbi:RagB/SusD family nutrient uptake outer membrane protein [Aurantibacter sp.]|uniref:RagB/SusD family nutrient uptake outer membrane protein n=1 Tax=Aurantibacter sp. TaxID=2807103 RepID=UPI003265FB5F